MHSNNHTHQWGFDPITTLNDEAAVIPEEIFDHPNPPHASSKEMLMQKTEPLPEPSK